MRIARRNKKSIWRRLPWTKILLAVSVAVQVWGYWQFRRSHDKENEYARQKNLLVLEIDSKLKSMRAKDIPSITGAMQISGLNVATTPHLRSRGFPTGATDEGVSTRQPLTTADLVVPTSVPEVYSSKEEVLSQQPVPHPESRVKVGLCAIIKDSEKYLDEWVDYNLLGIDFHAVYIYDNSANNTLKAWGEKRKRNGEGKSANIEVLHYPDKKKLGRGGTMQLEAYDNCTRRYQNKVDYFAYFDDDEFLVLHKHDTVGDFVRDHYINGTSLSINWKVFGTSHHTGYSPIPVLKRFQYHDGTSRGVKTICRPQDFKFMRNPHAVTLKNTDNQFDSRDTNGGGNFSKDGAQNLDKPDDVAVLHHYYYKSEQEWKYRNCVRQDVSSKRLRKCGLPTMAGRIFDDTAWKVLKSRVPRYAVFEDFPDYN